MPTRALPGTYDELRDAPQPVTTRELAARLIGFHPRAGGANTPAVLDLVLALFALVPMALSALAVLVLWTGAGRSRPASRTDRSG
jgi:hypothetical protein